MAAPKEPCARTKSFGKKHGSRVVRIGQTVGNVGRILVIGRHGVDVARLDRLKRDKVVALVFGLFRNDRQIARIQKNQIRILLQHKLQIRFVKALSILSVGNTASADGRKRSEAAVGAGKAVCAGKRHSTWINRRTDLLTTTVNSFLQIGLHVFDEFDDGLSPRLAPENAARKVNGFQKAIVDESETEVVDGNHRNAGFSCKLLGCFRSVARQNHIGFNRQNGLRIGRITSTATFADHRQGLEAIVVGEGIVSLGIILVPKIRRFDADEQIQSPQIRSNAQRTATCADKPLDTARDLHGTSVHVLDGSVAVGSRGSDCVAAGRKRRGQQARTGCHNQTTTLQIKRRMHREAPPLHEANV
mgnify:CR=1 FL=1